MKIGYIGMSHLGIVSSVCSAKYCKKVICFDLNNNKIDKLNKGNLIIKERNLKKIYNRFKKKIFFTNDIKHLNECDFIYLSIDTKTKNNIIDLTQVEYYIKLFKSHFLNKKKLIILSQLPFNFIQRNNLIKDHNIEIQVETLIFGNAVERFINPERIIFGTENNKIPNIINSFLKKFKCPIIKMNRESALLTKMSINLYLASQVTVTNYLSNICELNNVDWDPIREALSLDRRIGKYAYLSPGLGLSGGNVERDLFNLKNLSKEKKMRNSIVQSIIYDSDLRKEWVYQTLEKLLNKKSNKIGILGISYKSGTNSIKNSPAVNIVKQFKKINFDIYDPLVLNSQIESKNINFKSNINSLLIKNKIIIIMNNDKYYLKNIKFFKKKHIIIDPFRVLFNYKYMFKNYFCLGL